MYETIKFSGILQIDSPGTFPGNVPESRGTKMLADVGWVLHTATKDKDDRESKWIERNHRGQRGRPMTTWTKIREKDGTAVKFAPAWYEERPRTEQQSVEECYAQLGFSKDVFIACVRDRISHTFGTT